MRFEWDETKAAANLAKHGISFPEAAQVFTDPFAVDEIDTAHSTPIETRYTITGLAAPGLLFVVYREPRREVIRIIHARRPEHWMVKKYEQNKKRS